MSDTFEAVRTRYAEAARRLAVVEGDPCGDACCGDGCCGGVYDEGELSALGLSSGISLGCGNPTLLADLAPGQVVVDLGSGAGLDVLLSARRVAPGGHAYGVDMTDAMLELARANAVKAGVDNATFLRGTIDRIPLPDGAADVVISNCVINLAEDKAAVIAEAFRVLRPGGLFAVADIVEVERLAPELKHRVDAWAGCISGSIPADEYAAILVAAGFDEPQIEIHSIQQMPGTTGKVGSAYIRARRPAG
jgi:SAM-dependent methyltransferase